jgi:oligopeptide/dipeptide ABC transporter ATP-binding protein
MSAPLLEVRDLRVQFHHADRCIAAVNGLSYELSAGKTLAIIGESGSGKTVSCRALMGLLPESATVTGSVLLDGESLLGLKEREWRRQRGGKIAMIFQDAARSLNPTMRAGHQVTEAIRQHHAVDAAKARARALELFDLLRVPQPSQCFRAYPHELSGGMRQRVMIAMAICGNPRILIADEATRSLDAITQAETLKLLRNLQRQFGMALLMTSHDLRLTASFADDVLVMYAGRAVERAPTGRLFSRARMPYTRALLDASPHIQRRPHVPFPGVQGQPPDPAALPQGCAFEPRCASAREICRVSSPALEQYEERHWSACWHPSRYDETT